MSNHEKKRLQASFLSHKPATTLPATSHAPYDSITTDQVNQSSMHIEGETESPNNAMFGT